MMQKPWFKAFIWIMASAFFFMASSILISYWSPGPTESQVMQFKSGMMGAMESSMMGLAMSLESDTQLKSLIVMASSSTIPLIFISVVLGIYFRFFRVNDNAK